MTSIKIGFFDSGIGGISVMTYARERIPLADYIYYADTDHVPYGLKTREEIISYSDEAVRYLMTQGVSTVVIACNTATSMAVEVLREKYGIPIIGMEPAVKPAAQFHPGEKILVCATPVTIAGEKLHSLIEHHFSYHDVQPTLIPLPGLVTYAEQAIFDTEIVCNYLAGSIENPEQYTAVVLGCTHFPYFRDSFRKFFGASVDLIDGTAGTVRRLMAVLEELGYHGNGEVGTVRYIRSGREITAEEDLRYFHLLEERSRQELCHETDRY